MNYTEVKVNDKEITEAFLNMVEGGAVVTQLQAEKLIYNLIDHLDQERTSKVLRQLISETFEYSTGTTPRLDLSNMDYESYVKFLAKIKAPKKPVEKTKNCKTCGK